MVRSLRYASIAGALAGLILVAGCSEPTASPKSDPKGEARRNTDSPGKEAVPKGDGEHGHKPSAHGGIVVPIGSDSYHAEAVFEKGGILRLYTLGQNDAVVLEVEAQPLTGYVKLEGGPESESFVLTPRPQSGDKQGMTSLFIGHFTFFKQLRSLQIGNKFYCMVRERFILIRIQLQFGDYFIPCSKSLFFEIKFHLQIRKHNILNLN